MKRQLSCSLEYLKEVQMAKIVLVCCFLSNTSKYYHEVIIKEHALTEKNTATINGITFCLSTRVSATKNKQTSKQTSKRMCEHAKIFMNSNKPRQKLLYSFVLLSSCQKKILAYKHNYKHIMFIVMVDFTAIHTYIYVSKFSLFCYTINYIYGC